VRVEGARWSWSLGRSVGTPYPHCGDCVDMRTRMSKRRRSAGAGDPVADDVAGVVVVELGVRPGDAHDRLGPHLGALPPDVLKLVLIELDDLSRALFARASGACWRAVKDAQLSPRLDGATCVNVAAREVRLRVLRYLRSKGHAWNRRTCVAAARGGHLQCLVYAREKGCPWDEWTCALAARGGHLECLEYARENRCRWDDWTCSNAAKGDHLECLVYAHENGCPWDWRTRQVADDNGHWECRAYAHENVCPRQQ
jgi:hypothetical protein